MTARAVQDKLLAILRDPVKAGKLAPLFPVQLRQRLIAILEGEDTMPQVVPGWSPPTQSAALLFCLGAAWAARFIGEPND